MSYNSFTDASSAPSLSSSLRSTHSRTSMASTLRSDASIDRPTTVTIQRPSPFINPDAPPPPTEQRRVNQNWNGRKICCSPACIITMSCCALVVWTIAFGLLGLGICAQDASDSVTNCRYNHPHAVTINATSFNATSFNATSNNGTILHNVNCPARWDRYFASCVPVGLCVSIITSWVVLCILTYGALHAYVLASSRVVQDPSRPLFLPPSIPMQPMHHGHHMR